MIIQIPTIEDFIEELKASAPLIAFKTVRFLAHRGALQPEAISWQVDCWATAMVTSEEHEPAILEFAANLGREYEKPRKGPNEDEERDGPSRRAKAIAAQLKEACEPLGLQLRPGRIEAW